MKSTTKTIIIALLVIAVAGGAGYYALQSFSSPDKKIGEAAQEAEKELEKASGSASAASTSEEEEIGLDETEFQIHLHQMTHQKIVATEKRGAIEMTGENIDNMLKIARANEGSYEHYSFYEDALTAWQEGDFSNAVNVHNTIWEWHNGIVGRATGLMTPEQEERFIEENFR